MKIAIISNLYAPLARGGAERVAQITAKGFAHAGHDVIVITTKPEWGMSVEQNGKQKIYRFRPLNLFCYLELNKHGVLARAVWHVFDMFNPDSAWCVRKILRQERPDLVITHNLKGIGYLIPAIIRRLKIKHVHVVHDVQLAVPSGLIIKGNENASLVSGFAARIYSRACRALFGSPDAVISPSSWLMKFYEAKGFFPKSLKKVFPNPLSAVSPPAAVKTHKQNRCLFVGQLEEHKGIQWLIDFWRKNMIGAELLVVGDGSLALNNMPRNVKILGRLDGDRLNNIFVQVDFLIMPSLCYENSPTVIQLAYQNATPVIVADIGGAGELVEKGKTGFLFEAEDADSLRNALNMASALTDAEYEKMSRNCLNQIRDFSFRKYLEKLLA